MLIWKKFKLYGDYNKMTNCITFSDTTSKRTPTRLKLVIVHKWFKKKMQILNVSLKSIIETVNY